MFDRTQLLESLRGFHVVDLGFNCSPDILPSLIASQLIGYGMAGILRPILVYPTFAVYPHIIPAAQLFDALHRGKMAVMQRKR